MNLKIRYKIMLLFTLLVTGIISLLTGSIYYSANAERVAAFDRRLKARANYNTQFYALMGDSAFYLMRRNDSVSAAGIVGSRSIAHLLPKTGSAFIFSKCRGTRPMVVSDTLFQEVREKGEVDFTMGNRDADRRPPDHPKKELSSWSSPAMMTMAWKDWRPSKASC